MEDSNRQGGVIFFLYHQTGKLAFTQVWVRFLWTSPGNLVLYIGNHIEVVLGECDLLLSAQEPGSRGTKWLVLNHHSRVFGNAIIAAFGQEFLFELGAFPPPKISLISSDILK